MKAVILAGGLGTRISEETHLRPKPMIEIGGRPMLWHIMKMYAAHAGQCMKEDGRRDHAHEHSGHCEPDHR